MLSKDPQLMNVYIESLLKNNGLEETLYLAELTKLWRSILGDNCAKYCEPIKLKNQILTIKVYSSAWREELKLRKEKIIDIINQKMNHKIVNELKLR